MLADCGGQPALADRSAQMVREMCTLDPLENGDLVSFVALDVYQGSGWRDGFKIC